MDSREENMKGLPEKLTITVAEAAKLLGIGRGSAYEAVRRGELPTIVIGRRILVSRRGLEETLESSRKYPREM